ncbi:hypothetical protein Vi05172_g124 [Venturia inaequalis]|nr:hypothetical protein Vi05172_g124 [Venturia inaequalis]
MSDVLSTNNVDLIKLALFNLAAWLVPQSISGIASACQQYGWNTMVDTYSAIIGNHHELSCGCQTIQALTDGLKARIPEPFIEEELIKLLRKSEVLYASDATALLYILRRKTNRQANQAAILRLIQKNVRNSTFLAEFLNLLHRSRDRALKAMTHMFFVRLLPIFSLTYTFMPYRQPLKRTDNLSSRSEDDSEPNNPLQEEEELFDEWKEEWEHLEDDSMPEASLFNPAIEVHEGQRLFDEALGGKELALLIQAASQLGLTAEIKQILGLAVIKLGQSKVEQSHDILSAFLDTMLLRKIGRTVLETHKADICAMIAVYTRHYLTTPIDDMARPRSECDCFRCKALIKYLEDPNLKTQVFINESPLRYQHLLQQVQMAHHRFTWEYKYGPKDVLSGEGRARYPDTWSSELRNKRFPKPWIASKGYKCSTRENDHIQELTVIKTSRAQEIFEERLYKAGKLEAKVAASRLGASFWDDARKSAQSVDRVGILQSHKLAAAEAKAKQLIAALDQEVARTPTRVCATGLGVSEKLPESSRHVPLTARIATPQTSSKVITSKGVSTGTRTSRSASISKKAGGTIQPTSARSSRFSKRAAANRRVIQDSESDGDGDFDSYSDYESTQRVTENVTSTESAPTGLVPSNSRAAPVKQGPSQSVQRHDIREPDQSATDQNRGHTSALRSLQQGVWGLRAEQVRIDLGPLVLLDDEFLLGLDKLSKSSSVCWKDALAVLRQVQKERKDEERKRAVTSSKAWLPSDTTAALMRIVTKRMEPLATKPLSTVTSPPSSLTLPPEIQSTTPETRSTTPEIQSTTPEIQSTTPPGDPPLTTRISGSFAYIPTAVFRRVNKDEEQVRQFIRPMAPTTGQIIAKKIIGPVANSVNVEKRQSTLAATTTSRTVRRPVTGSETPRSSKPSELSSYEIFSNTSAVSAATRVPVPTRPWNIVGGKASAADEATNTHASTTPPLPSVQQARVVDDSAKSHESQARTTEVTTLDDADSEEIDDSNGTRAVPARPGAKFISTTTSTPQTTSLSSPRPASRPSERTTLHGQQGVLGSTDGSGDTLPGIANILRRIPDTTSSPQPSRLMGSRATGSRDGKDSAIVNSRHTTPHWPLSFAIRPPTVPVAILERFKNGGFSGTAATRAVHAAQNATSNTIAGGSRIIIAPQRPVAPTAHIAMPSTSATRERDVAKPVAQIMHMSINAGNKRSADDAGLSSNGRLGSTRRKRDAPKVPTQVEVIDLVDSDEEYVLPVAHMLPGHRDMPISID